MIGNLHLEQYINSTTQTEKNTGRGTIWGCGTACEHRSVHPWNQQDVHINWNTKVRAEKCDSVGYHEHVRGYLCASVPENAREHVRGNMRENVRENVCENMRKNSVKTA